jgi:hypothetical protein
VKSGEKTLKSGHTTGFFRMLERDNAPQRGKIDQFSSLFYIFQRLTPQVLRLDRVTPRPYGLAAFAWLRARRD